jgi:hypothetical protein
MCGVTCSWQNWYRWLAEQFDVKHELGASWQNTYSQLTEDGNQLSEL